MRRLRRDGRRRRAPALGGVRVSLRWEVGAPLFLIGLMISALMIGVEGAGLLFWIGASLMAAGIAFLVQPR